MMIVRQCERASIVGHCYTRIHAQHWKILKQKQIHLNRTEYSSGGRAISTLSSYLGYWASRLDNLKCTNISILTLKLDLKSGNVRFNVQ